jgi:hypothetical protein
VDAGDYSHKGTLRFFVRKLICCDLRSNANSGVTLQSLPIRRDEDINEAIEQAVRERAHGLVVLSSPLIFLQRPLIASMAFGCRQSICSILFQGSAG